MGKYYKLYHLENSKLASNYGDREYIELDKVYTADDPHFNICFARIDNILDYKDEFGLVVCDIEPVGDIIDSLPGFSKVESECKSVIARNPRSIYSPEFIQELIKYGSDFGAWSYIADESYVYGAINHFNEGSCYDINLNYDLSKSLQLLLLDVYDKEKLDNRFDYKRKNAIDYENIFKTVKRDRDSKKIVLEAWNKYAPCKKSIRLEKFSF